MKTNFVRLPAAAAFLVLASCATAPKSEIPAGAVNQARWETKLRVKDLRKDKSHSVSADVIGERGGSMRMEVTAILGYPVASYVMSDGGFRCAVYPEKKFYEGPIGERALQPVLKVPVSPVILRMLAFDEPLGGSQWKCSGGTAAQPEKCESAALGTKISWQREGAVRKIRIEAPGYEMDWAFGAPRTDVQLQESTFRLEAPKGFKVIRL